MASRQGLGSLRCHRIGVGASVVVDVDVEELVAVLWRCENLELELDDMPALELDDMPALELAADMPHILVEICMPVSTGNNQFVVAEYIVQVVDGRTLSAVDHCTLLVVSWRTTAHILDHNTSLA
jgi:hypothetical protein